jgi:hypothetical protein
MRRPSLALLGCLTALVLLPAAAHAQLPVEGRWQMGDGVVELHSGADGIESHWVKQRSGLSCPAIEDRDGDMHLSGSGRGYTGTWTWGLHKVDGSCEAIGRGPLTVTVAPDGKTAELHGDPPPGFTGSESHTLTRPGVRVPPLRRLSQAQRAVLAGARRVASPAPEPAFLAAVGLFPGARLDSLPRLQRLPVGFSG